MTNYDEVANYLDQKFMEGHVKPLNVVLDILENHILEDGVSGVDLFQDNVGAAWKLLLDAYQTYK